MGRLILGIVAGMVVALATVFAIDLAGHHIYPVPSDLVLRDPEAVGAFIRTMPEGALALVLIAWFAGAMNGGFAASLIARKVLRDGS